MLPYLVRRIVGAAVTWLLATFLLYSLLVSPSIPPEVPRYVDCPFCSPSPTAVARRIPKAYEAAYGLDRPWPLNYLAWLFHPNGPIGQPLTFPGGEVTRVRLSPGTLGPAYSGVLVGDFGYSLSVEPGAPVLEMYGINLPLILSLILTAFSSSFLIVVLQRRGRPALYGHSAPESPAKSLWRRAELWPLG